MARPRKVPYRNGQVILKNLKLEDADALEAFLSTHLMPTLADARPVLAPKQDQPPQCTQEQVGTVPSASEVVEVWTPPVQTDVCFCREMSGGMFVGIRKDAQGTFIAQALSVNNEGDIEIKDTVNCGKDRLEAVFRFKVLAAKYDLT